MDENFNMVKEYLLEMGHDIVYENDDDGVLVINNEESGISNLVLGVADPILVVEQLIFEISHSNEATYKRLLQMNREIIHGAFVLDETGKKVMFRNTHELQNLDLNELEATINSLGLLLSEYSSEIIKMSNNK